MHTHDLAEWRHDHQFDTGNIARDDRDPSL